MACFCHSEEWQQIMSTTLSCMVSPKLRIGGSGAFTQKVLTRRQKMNKTDVIFFKT